MMELLADATVWLLISFIIFTVILWRAGKSAVVSMLDDRISTIQKDIETAENLRTEAQELLAQYQRKHRNAVKDAEKIIANAESHAEEIRKQADKELKELMARRKKQLEERLANMEKNAAAQIQKYAADLAIKATKEIIANQLDKKSNENLVDQAIKDVGKNIR